MMYFKCLSLTCIPFVITMFMSYLIGSFISASWNPEIWTLDTRIYMSFVGMCFGYAVYCKLSHENLL